jgi:hypothetical protein
LNGIKVHVIKEKVLIMKYNYCVVRSGSTRWDSTIGMEYTPFFRYEIVF